MTAMMPPMGAPFAGPGASFGPSTWSHGGGLSSPRSSFRGPGSVVAPMGGMPMPMTMPMHPDQARHFHGAGSPPYNEPECDDSFFWGLFDANHQEPVAAQARHVPPAVEMRFMSASSSRQHPLKTEEGYADADVVEEHPCFLGLCDGVSEVQHRGLSGDELPRDLLARLRDQLHARDTTMSHGDDTSWLTEILKDSFKETECQGATTLLTAVIEDGKVLIGNLGDSIGLLLRRNPSQPHKFQIVYQTTPMVHGPNRPYQAVRLDGECTEDEAVDSVAQTKIVACNAQHGDILVLGSDGVFDNLHNEDVVRIVERMLPWIPPRPNGQWGPQQPGWGNDAASSPAPPVPQLEDAADEIVNTALSMACRPEADAAGELQWPPHARQTPVGLGGKPDDTTVIVSAIVQVSDTEAHDEFFYKVHGNGGWFGTKFGRGNTKDACRCS